MKALSIIIIYCAGGMPAIAQSTNWSNGCVIRILTNNKEYEFSSQSMSARLNDVLDRFEFSVPINSCKSRNDPNDINFLKAMADESDSIQILASLPDDKDAQLDLSYFKGNQSIQLGGALKIGSITLEDDIDFNGMLMDGNHGMAFNFDLFINTRSMTLKNVNNEQILEIELDAKGDKIIGISSN